MLDTHGAGDGELRARGHAADHCFERLARALLAGDIAAGDELPPERVLAERYGVSRLIVRQAVHRLAEVGLVRVRQGGATIALDPDQAADLRVIELRYRLSKVATGEEHDLLEVQLLRGHALLQLAALHGGKDELAALGPIVDRYAYAGGPDGRHMREFEAQFWGAVARAGGNQIYIVETAWLYRMLEQHPAAQHPAMVPPAPRIHFYRELARRLAERDDAPAFYLAVSRPILEGARKTTRPRPARRRSKETR